MAKIREIAKVSLAKVSTIKVVFRSVCIPSRSVCIRKSDYLCPGNLYERNLRTRLLSKGSNFSMPNLKKKECQIALKEITRVTKGKSFLQVDAYRNKKEKVVKQKHVNIIEFMVELIRNFLYNNDFRYTMTTAIMRANTTALALFDFLYHIVIDFDIKHIVDISDDTTHAFSWLHLMKTVRSQG